MREYIEKKVFVRLINGDIYTGLIIGADDVFVTMRDKFNSLVSFRIVDLEKIQEVVDK